MEKTKRLRFPMEVILVCIRWYAAYPLSYRHIEEMMEERGVVVGHSSINRWSIRFLPILEKVFRLISFSSLALTKYFLYLAQC